MCITAQFTSKAKWLFARTIYAVCLTKMLQLFTAENKVNSYSSKLMRCRLKQSRQDHDFEIIFNFCWVWLGWALASKWTICMWRDSWACKNGFALKLMGITLRAELGLKLNPRLLLRMTLHGPISLPNYSAQNPKMSGLCKPLRHGEGVYAAALVWSFMHTPCEECETLE